MTKQLSDAAGGTVAIGREADVIEVRQVLRGCAQHAGFGLVDQTKLITAGSELARNILVYSTGRQGRVAVECVEGATHLGVRATFRDDGPGIDDVDAALTEGYSTGGSLGLGLPGSRRLVDELTVVSTRGSGTTVMILKWAR